jgi:hypothetical protein
MTTHRFTLPSLPGIFFTKSNTTVVPLSPYFSLFLRLKAKPKGRHSDRGRIAGGAEHDFQDTF